MKPESNRDNQVVPLGWLNEKTPTCRIKYIRKREGRCYELAIRGCLRAPEWELVHGECNGRSGGRNGHAWLEFDGEAYCPVLDQCMPIALFVSRLGAVSYARYSAEDVMFLRVKYWHGGPWGEPTDRNE